MKNVHIKVAEGVAASRPTVLRAYNLWEVCGEFRCAVWHYISLILAAML